MFGIVLFVVLFAIECWLVSDRSEVSSNVPDISMVDAPEIKEPQLETAAITTKIIRAKAVRVASATQSVEAKVYPLTPTMNLNKVYEPTEIVNKNINKSS